MVKILPPQAYTWAILKEAYNWLQSQPASIRELAQSADDAVSLYKQHLRSQKQNNSESFKAELKNLSQGLKKFDSGGEEPPPLADSLSLPTPHQALNSPPPQNTKAQTYPSPPQQQAQQVSSQKSHQALPPQPHPDHLRNNRSPFSPQEDLPITAPLPSTPTTDSLFSPNSLSSISLDEKTQVSLHIARERLNLGSSQEALRVLVALGIEKLKEVLPKT